MCQLSSFSRGLHWWHLIIQKYNYKVSTIDLWATDTSRGRGGVILLTKLRVVGILRPLWSNVHPPLPHILGPLKNVQNVKMPHLWRQQCLAACLRRDAGKELANHVLMGILGVFSQVLWKGWCRWVWGIQRMEAALFDILQRNRETWRRKF